MLRRILNGLIVLTVAFAISFAPTFVDAGAVPGPVDRHGHVRYPDDLGDTLYITFRGGEMGRVWLRNMSHRGDLDLFVFNQKGARVAADMRANESAHVSFFAPRTETYRVRVVLYPRDAPPGRVYYHLRTN